VRFLTINTKNNFNYIFEIYNLPPDRTGILPDFLNHEWKEEIIKRMEDLEGLKVGR